MGYNTTWTCLVLVFETHESLAIDQLAHGCRSYCRALPRTMGILAYDDGHPEDYLCCFRPRAPGVLEYICKKAAKEGPQDHPDGACSDYRRTSLNLWRLFVADSFAIWDLVLLENPAPHA